MAYGAYRNFAPLHYVYIRGAHIHHLVWGMLLLLAVGFYWLIEVGEGSKSSSLLVSRLMSRLDGVSAALTLHEFVLWLNVEERLDWTRRDFASLDAIIFSGSALLIGTWGGDFLKAVACELRHPQPKHRRAR
jgi:hypothetical protein